METRDSHYFHGNPWSFSGKARVVANNDQQKVSRHAASYNLWEGVGSMSGKGPYNIYKSSIVTSFGLNQPGYFQE